MVMLPNYDKSEDFRAQILFTAGFAFCSPLGIILTSILQNGECKSWGGFFVAVFFFLLGIKTIVKSYDIMEKKDGVNAHS